MRRLHRAAGFVCICLALSCGPRQRHYNVVLIGVDTLRADHLGCYGYHRNTTPSVDRFAESGVLFENVVCPSPWTLTSFATVLTSLYPTQHGAISSHTSLGTSFPTLATLLRDEGYATGAIINAPYLKPKYKLDRGFDYYGMPPKTGRVAANTTEDALEWIDLNLEQPFFIFVHYFDPHLPYEAPAPYDTLFDPGYEGEIEDHYDPENLPRARAVNFNNMKSLTAADWNHIKSLYDGEVAFTDEAIGTLLKGLEERGLRDNTLIVFLSDHGEEFYDHGGFEHGHTLFDELIKAPLIFSLSDVLPQDVRLSRQVRLLDVVPTILDLLGIRVSTHFEGVSLKPLLLGKTRPAEPAGATLLPPEIAYSEAMLYYFEKKCLTAYPWKLIYDMRTGEEKFFNLAEDPEESVNIVGRLNESLALLEETLAKTIFGISDTWYIEMAGGDREHLFSLDISCKEIGRWGGFGIPRMLDEDQDIIDPIELGGAVVTPSKIRFQNLKIEDPLTLAFKFGGKKPSMRIDLQIGGRPATHETFIGKDLLNPVTMPFVEHDARDEQADKGRPHKRPEPPYFLIWRSGSKYEDDTSIELDEETKNELRALGYIQ
jgi:arylsulfatase A-like enzyme